MRPPVIGDLVLFFPDDDDTLLDLACNEAGEVVGLRAVVVGGMVGLDHQVTLSIPGIGGETVTRDHVPYSDNETSTTEHWCYAPDPVYADEDL